MKIKASLIGIALIVAGGSALARASSVETFQLADLKRVTTSKDSSGEVTRDEQPVSPASDDDHRRHHRGRDHGEDGGSAADNVLNAFVNVLFNAQSADGSDHSSPVEARPRHVTLEAGYVYLRIFNNLDSLFRSPNLPDAHWDDTLHLRAQGAEGTLLYGVEDYFAVGLNAGGFGDSHVANAQSENGFHVQEHIDVSGGWGAMELRLYPVPFLSVHGDVGILGYSLHTRAITNASTFTYEGFEGAHADAIVGLGGRLETPWRWPLRVYAGGRYWWIGGDKTPSIDTGVAQFDAGLSLRF